MKLSVSNILWNVEDDDKIFKILNKNNITCIDIAPTKYHDIVNYFNPEDFVKIKNFWNENSIQITGMQSLFFGLPKITMFENEYSRQILIKHLKKIFIIADILEVKYLVFGSPSIRKYQMSDLNKSYYEIAKEFFLEVSEILSKYNSKICIEPNPKDYGCDFINNSYECFEFINDINKPNIKAHFDLGSSVLNKENIEQVFKDGIEFINYFHISEPYLMPPEDDTFHKNISGLLKSHLNLKHVSLEVNANNIKSINQIENVISFVTNCYVK